jgi:DNA polymerase-4
MEGNQSGSILHIDMDAFFAAIEQLDFPKLRGKPVLVGGSADARGVVSTASYEARVFGCHSAMPMAAAVKRCPHAVIMPVRMSRYSEISDQVCSIFERYTPHIEPVSIDEAFLDVSGCEKLFGSPVKIAKSIQKEVHEKTHLTCSIGVAGNKFLAKLASDLKKPNGLVIVPMDELQPFLDPLPVSRLWGVGKATLPEFEKRKLRTFADVRRCSLHQLESWFGSAGEMFYQFVRGIDDRSVVPDYDTKSISTETTFPVNIRDFEFLRGVLLDQIDHISGRLRHEHLFARTVTLKIRSPEFKTLTRSKTLDVPTDITDHFWLTVSSLFDSWKKISPFPVRLIGAGLSSLTGQSGRQLLLFDQEETQKKETLDHTIDQIRDKFGSSAIFRALTKPDRNSE